MTQKAIKALVHKAQDTFDSAGLQGWSIGCDHIKVTGMGAVTSLYASKDSHRIAFSSGPGESPEDLIEHLVNKASEIDAAAV